MESFPREWQPGRYDVLDFRTPKGLHPIAQGRAAHPGKTNPPKRCTPKGFHNRDRRGIIILYNPFGVENPFGITKPGCAARRWAMGCNAFGVSRHVSVKLLNAS